MIELEILVILLFIVIALVVSYMQGRKRALRQAKLDYEYEMKLKEWEQQRTEERKKRQLATKAAPIFGSHVPQDASLRRHYLHHLQTMLISLGAPRPTDCALRRHYDSRIASELEQCLQDESQAQRLLQNYHDYQQALAENQAPQQTSAVTEFKSKPLLNTSTIEPAAKAAKIEIPLVKNRYIPEDATLKRHYLSNLRSMIESLTGPRPTDSTLRRHYDAMIDTELNMQLGQIGH